MKLFNKPIRILLITNGLILIASAMLGPIYALFVERVGGSLLDASFAFGAYALAAGITTLTSGKVADKVKENELIVVFGYVVMACGFFGYMLVNSVWSLLLVQVIIGLGEAIYSPAFDAVYSKHLDGHKSGREWGAWESINYFTTAFGALFGGLLVTYLGFNAMFTSMGLLSLVSAGYIFRLPRKIL
ncbi:MFS transporter [Candidatus Microgenomates bacterium]|nr:MAG: MFS transporter [Candidatus Microgenomates bacterium]